MARSQTRQIKPSRTLSSPRQKGSVEVMERLDGFASQSSQSPGWVLAQHSQETACRTGVNYPEHQVSTRARIQSRHNQAWSNRAHECPFFVYCMKQWDQNTWLATGARRHFRIAHIRPRCATGAKLLFRACGNLSRGKPQRARVPRRAKHGTKSRHHLIPDTGLRLPVQRLSERSTARAWIMQTQTFPAAIYPIRDVFQCSKLTAR